MHSDAPPLWYAAFWKKGVTINLGDFGATSAGFPCYETRRGSCSQATDINNKGQIIGFALNTTGETHAFLWHKKGGMTDLSKLGGSGLLSPSFADINDKGQVVGWALTPNKERHAILWDSKCVRVHNRDFEKDDSKKDRN